MGTPAIFVYMCVLYDLRIRKSTDSLVEMLAEFPDHAKQIAAAPANKTSTIRQIMDELLKNKAWFPYFQQMLDCLGPQILLHEANEDAPNLLTRIVELCDAEYVSSIYDQLKYSE